MMVREWRHLKMLKCASRAYDPDGVDATALGELQSNVMPAPFLGWKYMLMLTMDTTFRLKSKLRGLISDPSLSLGWMYSMDHTPYSKFVTEAADDKDDYEQRTWVWPSDQNICAGLFASLHWLRQIYRASLSAGYKFIAPAGYKFTMPAKCEISTPPYTSIQLSFVLPHLSFLTVLTGYNSFYGFSLRSTRTLLSLLFVHTPIILSVPPMQIDRSYGQKTAQIPDFTSTAFMTHLSLNNHLFKPISKFHGSWMNQRISETHAQFLAHSISGGGCFAGRMQQLL
ncbi:hypothetical protein FIBSPDRAFT_901406 [Athelia psychrophila]|uniref:Uncharacterized protein n=1 Tax=Athelia psychrophila TaxID=1759441 RepID=A0A165X6L4_9AGAM|nr:hypothetical protein FIBSPDRAFT_901406 [Fibularhizoctonia sp. CBS 109695]